MCYAHHFPPRVKKGAPIKQMMSEGVGEVGDSMVTIDAHGGGLVKLNVRRLYHKRISLLGGARARREHVQRALEIAAAG
jgi:hypothetical protein